MGDYEKKGYLNSEFRLFYLTGRETQEIKYHYHDFEKITIFLAGQVRYQVEGKAYDLRPYDIVLVGHGEIHRLLVNPAVSYERIVIYIAPAFMASYKTAAYDLSACFARARAKESSVIRPAAETGALLDAMQRLEQSLVTAGYAQELYNKVLFLEFLVLLNREARGDRLGYLYPPVGNDKVLQLLHYLNDHLKEDLSIERLAQTFYLSPHYLMRLFKKETGVTIGQYLAGQRLHYARELILAGQSRQEACFACGYRDYSTFYRAYRAAFGESPRETRTRS